ncbi:hypothetical protein [Methylomonas fluvii]|uniref:Uncharacterized protein n=1 Tax=Methylomonas fluvii TaxID=1854564 RepID=A0ABR9D940_9GAMM|nr:hypothetical protein [Methylomonas fluvii]MBD9359624.1 hypothetical protein [Methylomonas fluvii]
MSKSQKVRGAYPTGLQSLESHQDTFRTGDSRYRAPFDGADGTRRSL